MDSSRPQLLRLVLGAAALSVASAGLAAPGAAQDDRGGSSQPESGYRGPYLNWAGKVAAPTPQPPPAPAPALAPPADEAPLAPAASDGADGRRPAPPPVAMAAPDPAPPQPAPLAPPAPAPVPQAQATPAAAPAQLAQATPAAAPVSARYYSLHRQYGIAPDPDPAPADRPMVLIGPPDTPPAQPPASDAGAADGGASDSQDDAGGADPAPHHPTGPDAN